MLQVQMAVYLSITWLIRCLIRWIQLPLVGDGANITASQTGQSKYPL